MTKPQMSPLFESRKPSVIRMAQIQFDQRQDDTQAINVAIGNINLPMYPAMIKRMKNLDAPGSPFEKGVVMYSATSGTQECIDAFMNVIASSGFDTSGLFGHITEGGTQAMELLVTGICGPGGSGEKPLLLIDAAYTNYKTLCQRLDRDTCSITRTLGDDGKFSLPSAEQIEKVILEKKPGGIVVIPFDNPTGQYYDKQAMIMLAQLAVKHNLWLISDEAYRELYYTGGECTSIWGLTENDVPGITGRRISVETTSKVWNACGLRIGALVTTRCSIARPLPSTPSACAAASSDSTSLARWPTRTTPHCRAGTKSSGPTTRRCCSASPPR